jgi:flavin-dependent dehydrogenase
MYRPGFKPWGRLGALPVLLVGDAAGHVKITTVGGTVTGFAGAQAAVRSILHNTSYSKELREVKRELDLHYWIRWALNGLDNQGYDELLKSVSGSIVSFLSSNNRDSMASVFWKLPLLEPRLLRVGIRCLRGIARRKTPSP